MADPQSRPLIWVLKGLRAGDSAQAMELALQVGGRVESKQLSFNGTHVVPNWLMAGRVSHLTEEARTLLRPPWPDLVVATGKRTAPVGLWIKQQSGGRTRIVQLGRPRMHVGYFDLVVTTPQYGLPSRPNVIQVPLPFAKPKVVSPSELLPFQAAWADLSRPWIVGVLGGHKHPQRLSADEIAGFGKVLNAAARSQDGSIILLDSPRSPAGAIEQAASFITAPHWVYRRGVGANAYQPALTLGDAFVVTSDSVSMVTEMLLTGKPTSVFRLPVSALVPRWSAQSGLGAALAGAGLLHPPRDVDGFMLGLQQEGYLVEMGAKSKPLNLDAIAASRYAAVERIRSLLASSSES
jgi:uncharacterized protein